MIAGDDNIESDISDGVSCGVASSTRIVVHCGCLCGKGDSSIESPGLGMGDNKGGVITSTKTESARMGYGCLSLRLHPMLLNNDLLGVGGCGLEQWSDTVT